MAVTNKIIMSIKNDQYKLPNIKLRITESRPQKMKVFVFLGEKKRVRFILTQNKELSHQ